MDRRVAAESSPRPIVLLVERHEATRAFYALALSANGFIVVPTRDPAEAQRRAADVRPDIIATGLLMNGSASQFLQELKENVRTRHIPVVAINSFSAEELASALREVVDATHTRTET